MLDARISAQQRALSTSTSVLTKLRFLTRTSTSFRFFRNRCFISILSTSRCAFGSSDGLRAMQFDIPSVAVICHSAHARPCLPGSALTVKVTRPAASVGGGVEDLCQRRCHTSKTVYRGTVRHFVSLQVLSPRLTCNHRTKASYSGHRWQSPRSGTPFDALRGMSAVTLQAEGTLPSGHLWSGGAKTQWRYGIWSVTQQLEEPHVRVQVSGERPPFMR